MTAIQSEAPTQMRDCICPGGVLIRLLDDAMEMFKNKFVSVLYDAAGWKYDSNDCYLRRCPRNNAVLSNTSHRRGSVLCVFLGLWSTSSKLFHECHNRLLQSTQSTIKEWLPTNWMNSQGKYLSRSAPRALLGRHGRSAHDHRKTLYQRFHQKWCCMSSWLFELSRWTLWFCLQRNEPLNALCLVASRCVLPNDCFVNTSHFINGITPLTCVALCGCSCMLDVCHCMLVSKQSCLEWRAGGTFPFMRVDEWKRKIE